MAIFKKSIRNRLSPDAAELYDYTLKNFVMYRDWLFGSRLYSQDRVFRYLMKSAIDGTVTPKRWGVTSWRNEDLIAAAEDVENRIKAWSLIMDDSPKSWSRIVEQRYHVDKGNMLTLRGVASITAGLAILFV